MKLITSLLVVLALTACSVPEQPSFEPVDITTTIAPAPKPDPIYLKPVSFTVVTKDMEQPMGDNRVWYAITVNSYENLAFNTQEMLRVIREQRAAITYYEGLYITPN